MQAREARAGSKRFSRAELGAGASANAGVTEVLGALEKVWSHVTPTGVLCRMQDALFLRPIVTAPAPGS